jgi:hypothetical protein
MPGLVYRRGGIRFEPIDELDFQMSRSMTGFLSPVQAGNYDTFGSEENIPYVNSR